MDFRALTHKTLDDVQKAATRVGDTAAKAPAFVRSAALRLTSSGRRRLALEHGALHSQTREPGLTDLTATGVVHIKTTPVTADIAAKDDERKASDKPDAVTTDIPVHWYEVEPESPPSAPANDPVTIVFIHGFTLAGESWYRQFNALRKSHPEARLLTMDLRGHGQTGAVPASLCTVEGAAADALAVIAERAATGKLIVVGHSLGGLIALHMVRAAEESIRRRIAGVVLISTSIDKLAAQGVPQILASPVADAARNAIESSPKEIRKFREAIASLMAPSLAVAVFARRTDYEIIEFHAAMINETPLETFVGYLDDLQDHDEFAAGPHLEGLPGAVLVGTKDDVTPRKQADLIMEKWPDTELVEVDGAGHMLPLEAPDAVNRAIERVLEKVQKRS
ncbi:MULTISPECIES: alpha/beta fold hydrolase [Corynebacterium]|uniref:alpha/beta fold hydrolase n=1 Tax=Corynebacterium TaxID=1716 RepID=UPI0008B73736|nr:MULTISPECIES: alpha/beta hydrolase [Corynebacterium]MBC6758824.1 alpha/beta hydrolase [Corynebacterium sp. LK24]MCQ9128268.1 alpha/beta hydrolase [Corynebacterium amycolatum]MCQ9142140.1 alpha/beta hydrolase [Corynebacterium amycolatum]MCT1718526.1 alpha/beta hydrolase [Corynebacterium amycolatum]OFN07029.1 hydrolase [Corynebacterium sp. HMSC074C11]